MSLPHCIRGLVHQSGLLFAAMPAQQLVRPTAGTRRSWNSFSFSPSLRSLSFHSSWFHAAVHVNLAMMVQCHSAVLRNHENFQILSILPFLFLGSPFCFLLSFSVLLSPYSSFLSFSVLLFLLLLFSGESQWCYIEQDTFPFVSALIRALTRLRVGEAVRWVREAFARNLVASEMYESAGLEHDGEDGGLSFLSYLAATNTPMMMINIKNNHATPSSLSSSSSSSSLSSFASSSAHPPPPLPPGAPSALSSSSSSAIEDLLADPALIMSRTELMVRSYCSCAGFLFPSSLMVLFASSSSFALCLSLLHHSSPIFALLHSLLRLFFSSL